jgi:hypothetical protein
MVRSQTLGIAGIEFGVMGGHELPNPGGVTGVLAFEIWIKGDTAEDEPPVNVPIFALAFLMTLFCALQAPR